MKKRILVADDSLTARLMSEMILKRHSYEVITAVDGVEAVNMVVAQRPDLVLMDIVMPRMDGIAALGAIRSITEVADVPVIIVTTRSDTEYLEKGYEKGCNDYITKPVDGVELLAKIRNLIGG